MTLKRHKYDVLSYFLRFKLETHAKDANRGIWVRTWQRQAAWSAGGLAGWKPAQNDLLNRSFSSAGDGGDPSAKMAALHRLS